MKQQQKQTPDDAFREALQANIQGTRHALKFIARFVSALLKTRTSNLVKVANAFETDAAADSVYRQIQRFLRNENEISIDYLKLLNIHGKLKLLIDRTEWKFGATWVNILTLSVAYKNVAIPVLWETVNHKGNATAGEHRAIIEKFVAEFGAKRILRIYADREFGSCLLLKYLLENKIDFHIRLKTSHQSGGRSFLQRWRKVSEKVKLKGKVKIEVFGLELFVSCLKYQKDGKVVKLPYFRGRNNPMWHELRNLFR